MRHQLVRTAVWLMAGLVLAAVLVFAVLATQN